MKILETQFVFCNLSVRWAVDLGIAVLWPRNEKNSMFFECEFSQVLVTQWQTSALYRIIQVTLAASFITFVCSTYAFAHYDIQLISTMHLISW